MYASDVANTQQFEGHPTGTTAFEAVFGFC